QTERIEGARRWRGAQHVRRRFSGVRRPVRDQARWPPLYPIRGRQSRHRGGRWEKVEIASGDPSKNLPWTCPSGGSQTIHAMTRAAHAAGMDAKKKLQEIAAKDLGGKPEDYEVANQRIFRKAGGSGMTLAKAAQRAIDLG